MIQKVKDIFKLFESRRFLWPISAITGSLKKSLQNLRIQLIWKDSDGDWLNMQKDLTLYSPTILTDTLTEIKAKVRKYFFYKYEPRKGDIILDIGAGIGDDAIYFSDIVGKEGKVIAIEAHPHTYRCLKKTIEANNLENVVAINVACSESSGKIKITKNLAYLGNNIFHFNDENNDFIEVKSVTIDSILEELKIENVDFVKINIEGAEYGALKGASSILKNNTNLAISCHDFKYLEGKGDFFKTFELVKKLLSENEINYFSRESSERELPFYIYTSNIGKTEV